MGAVNPGMPTEMNAPSDSPLESGRSPRVGLYYGVLGTVTALVIAAVISLGSGKQAQPSIAGGYDTVGESACLGPKFDLAQSGRFVGITDAADDVSGDLTFDDGRLTGTVDCVEGSEQRLAATIVDGTLEGTLGGEPVEAVIKRSPAPPGTQTPRVADDIEGTYALAPSSVCLGGKVVLEGDGPEYPVKVGKADRGVIEYRDDKLSGEITCNDGTTRTVTGSAAGRALDVTFAPAGDGAGERVAGTKQRTPDETLKVFFLAILIVMLFARFCGSLMPRIGQPRVMGEVIAGIMLGPTVFAAITPGLQAEVFPPDIVPIIGVTAKLGLIFYMFLIGLEVDLSQIKGRVGITMAVSNTGLAIPMMLGMAVALPLYGVLAPDTRFLAFALFMGVAMSITAFPVLARILSERRMLKAPIGVLALSAAAIDDVSAWFLIALATAVAGAATGTGVLTTIGLSVLFCLVMGLGVRAVLRRAAVAYDEAGRLPGTWITIIFAGVLLSALATEHIGVAEIFGAFVMGLVMPRHAGLSHEVTQRVEDFVLVLLLPLFFAYTGLRTNVGVLDQPVLIAVTVGLCAIAILGKYGGTLIAARSMRLPWRESAALGALMNTRGLTELIVLNLALDKGVISPALFSALVIMALLTTFMAGPALRLIDPHNKFGLPPEDELAAAERLSVEETAPPERSILVAPQSAASVDALTALATPLARWQPRRELILARMVRPPRGSAVRAGLGTEEHLVREASEQLQQARLGLLDNGVATRAVALASANPGRDLSRLAAAEEIDLVLLDGHRPLLGDGVPREDVGTVLEEAPCDVAVLVARENAPAVLGPDGVVIVPFAGAEHDWAALELASWLCAATSTPLVLLGPPGKSASGNDATQMLANAALLVQHFAGVSATPLVTEPGREGIVAAASKATLLMMGLSERWNKEGLGETRRAIARAAPAPIVFVRRGTRPGALAPPSDVSRFAWSSPDLASSRAFSRTMTALNLPITKPGLPPQDSV